MYQIHLFNFGISWPSFIIPNPNGIMSPFKVSQLICAFFNFLLIKFNFSTEMITVRYIFRLSSYSVLR